MSETIDPDVEAALEERTRWISKVTERAAAGDWQAVQRAIDELDDEHLRGMIYVLILARANDWASLREAARDAMAREQFDRLDGDGPTLH